MLEFLRRNQVLLSSGLFLSFSLLLLVLNRGGVHRFDPLGAVFLEILRPLQLVTTQASGAVGGVWGRYVNLVGVEKQNRELRDRLRGLEEEHQHDMEIELENQRLSRLLDFQSEAPSQVVTARVIGKDASGIFESFVLDRGERDGVRAWPSCAPMEWSGASRRLARTGPECCSFPITTAGSTPWCSAPGRVGWSKARSAAAAR